MARRSRKQPQFMLSIPLGNLIQLSGLLGGLGLVARAARARVPWGTRMLATGWLLTYFCNHAIGHWALGRLLGIRFLGYGVHGTTAPGWYPPGMRWIFRHVPLFSAWTDPSSRRAAHPLARMAMYLGGPLFTGLTSLGIPLYGRASGVPRARVLQFSGSRQGSLSNVYDQVVTCAGLGGNYARSRTTANDPRELIPQPLLQWAVTTVGAKKPRAFSTPAASSASPTEPCNTICY
jgi:hypothetical protein